MPASCKEESNEEKDSCCDKAHPEETSVHMGTSHVRFEKYRQNNVNDNRQDACHKECSAEALTQRIHHFDSAVEASKLECGKDHP
jgi:hypothetical protein